MLNDLTALSDEELIRQWEIERDNASKYNVYQKAVKVINNALYGVFTNVWFRWFDIENAEGITYSGQIINKRVTKMFNEKLNTMLGTTDFDYVIAGDTDSVYLNLERLVTKQFPMGADNQTITDYLDEFCKTTMQEALNDLFKEHSEYTNAFQNSMYMKRESICDRAIWGNAKKKYILNVLDKEGTRFTEPKLEMKGLETVRSDTPEICRVKIEEVVKLIMNGTNDQVIKYISNFKKEYKSLPFDVIAYPKSINGLTSYADPDTIFTKGTPMHIKGALIYNHLLKQKNLDKKYPMVYNGDKIKFIHLKPINPTSDKVIAAPRILPPELGLNKYIDYEAAFDRTFLNPLKRILDVIGWQAERKNTLFGAMR